MKKTLGMIALTGGLVAAGCAMLPSTGAKAPASQPAAVGMSGPGTAILHMNGAERGVQAVGGGATFVFARIYAAAADTATPSTTFAASDSIETNVNGKYLTASGSVSTAGVATLTLPPLPAGKHVIQVIGYKGTPAINWATGVDSDVPGNRAKMVAQGESFVETAVGMPYSATFGMFARFLPVNPTSKLPDVNYVLDASASTNATSSMSLTLVTVPTTGTFFRIMDWNPFGNVGASKSIRVVLEKTTVGNFPDSIATNSTAAYWRMGHINAEEGFGEATNSFPTWNWGPNNNKRFIYADIDLASESTKTATYSADPSDSKVGGSLSFFLPKNLADAGVKIYLHDKGTAGSGDGTPTL